MVSVERIFINMFQTRFIIVFISVISDIYGQFPMVEDGSPTPVLDTRPVRVQATAGETVILPCAVTNLGSYTISWHTSEYELLTSNDSVVIDDDPRLSVRVIIDNTRWDLQIVNAEGTDSGTYICMVQTIPPQMKHVELTVKEPPYILASAFQEIIEVTEGKPLTVTCVTSGVPRPTVNWYIYREVPGVVSRPIKELYQGGHLLTINTIRRTDSAIYVCEAENENGRADKEMELVVNYTPVITMSTELIPVKEGFDALLECSAEGFPAPQIMWLRFNYRLTNSGKHGVEMFADSPTERTAILTVKQTEQEDEGRYRCLARNKVGQQDGYVNIIVIEPASTSSSTTSTTASTTTTKSTTTEPTSKRTPPQRSDPELLKKTTESSTVKDIAEVVTPKTGETKNSSSRTDTNLATFLSLLLLLYLRKLL